MRNGIFIPPLAVRIAVGAFAAAVVTTVAFSASDAVRYYKMKTM